MRETTERRKNADIVFDQMMRDRRDYEGWWRKLADMFTPNCGRFSKKYVVFGSSALLIDEDGKNVFHAKSLTAGS